MRTITKPVVNGQALYEACGFDRRLCALAILTRSDAEQEELLDSILPRQRADVAYVVLQIREALGLMK